MRLLQHDLGLWSVVFAPNGTLFVMTARDGRLWAHPAGGSDRVLVSAECGLGGVLEVSPDGRWLSVSGLAEATVFRIEPFDTSPADRLEWERYSFPSTRFYKPCHFTGKSKIWAGRVIEEDIPPRAKLRFQTRRLPKLEPTEHPVASALPCMHWATVPGTTHAVIFGRSAGLKSAAYWRVDLAKPNAPAELLGTSEHCHAMTIDPIGRLFVSRFAYGLKVYTPRGGSLNLDLGIPMPAFKSDPRVALSADGRRFVACAYNSKLVYAGDTATGELFGPWDWKIGQVNGVAVAPDGLTAAAAGSNKKVAVWDLE